MKTDSRHSGEQIFFLIYVSSATKMMNDEELLFLLEQSRRKNLTLNITGLLLYAEGTFIQILEGGRAEVEDLFYKTIAVDPRHHLVTVTMTGLEPKRSFPDWSMGFKSMERKDLASDIPGFSDLLQKPRKISDVYPALPGKMLALFRSFYSVTRQPTDLSQ